MKKLLQNLSAVVLGLSISASALAQTAGTLTFTFTPVSHTGYSSTKNVLAIWIQTSAGGFVKTKMRRAGSGTNDHLPTFSVNAGGTAGNCLAASVNVVSAATGATLTSFTAKTITWDGTDVNGNVVADGTYRVAVQETWNHGTTGTTIRYFNFTKGPNSDIQTPTADGNFTGISLQWIPTTTVGLDQSAATIAGVSVYPNPSVDGIFNVDYETANNIKVVNMLGVTVYDEKVDQASNSTTVDLSNLANGIYFVYVLDGNKASKHKVVIAK